MLPAITGLSLGSVFEASGPGSSLAPAATNQVQSRANFTRIFGDAAIRDGHARWRERGRVGPRPRQEPQALVTWLRSAVVC
jgi:hypothetical protein